ncbi:MAG: polysaccharide deacetylase family protein [Elusimicrobiota bacterium]
MKITVYKYELIIFIIIMILTGSVGLTSKDASISNGIYPKQRYPYTVALTFDDGPYPGHTENLLRILAHENVRATFFLTGMNSQQYPELVRLISDKNHEIGGHTYTHTSVKKMSTKTLITELDLTKKVIEQNTNKRIYLFRPPGGHLSKKSLDIIQSRGYVTVMWSVLPKDTEPSVNKEDIIRIILRETSNSGIILLHSGRQRTIDALPEIIWGLRLKGYRFVTVSELIITEGMYARGYVK